MDVGTPVSILPQCDSNSGIGLNSLQPPGFNPASVRFKQDVRQWWLKKGFGFNPASVRFKLAHLADNWSEYQVSILPQCDSNPSDCAHHSGIRRSFNPASVRFKRDREAVAVRKMIEFQSCLSAIQTLTCQTLFEKSSEVSILPQCDSNWMISEGELDDILVSILPQCDSNHECV